MESKDLQNVSTKTIKDGRFRKFPTHHSMTEGAYMILFQTKRICIFGTEIQPNSLDT